MDALSCTPVVTQICKPWKEVLTYPCKEHPQTWSCYCSKDVVGLSSLQRQTHEQRERAGRSTRSLGNILIRIIPVHNLIFIMIFKRVVVPLGITWTFEMS